MGFNFSDRCKNLEGNAIREIFKLLERPDIISFAGGMPASKALPLDIIKELTDEILSSKDAYKILQYGATEGYKPYLEACIAHLKRDGIFGVDFKNVLSVSGGQQGIDLSLKAFINKGDAVLVENPTYLAVLHILKTYEAKVYGVESNENGIDIDDLLVKIEKYKPKMIYLVPTFSNPTGKTVPVENRKRLAEIASEYNIMLIEDNPYGELRYAGSRIPAIKSFDKTGNVIYLSSFSKTISPGLRVGFAVAEETVLRKLVIGKQATDVHTSVLSQAIAALYLERGHLDPVLSKNIPLYREKMNAMLSAIGKYLPSTAEYTVPEGGLFIWLTLAGTDTSALFPEAAARGVAYVPGQPFFAEGGGKNCLRLNFSNAEADDINKGISILGSLLS